MQKSLITLTILVSALATGSPVQAAKLYKWVAEDGSVYYSDKVPPSENQRAREELSKSGVHVKQVGSAKSAEDIAREQQEKLLREEQERILAIQKRRDSVLLKTFRSVDDIILARDGKLATYDTQIKLTHKNIQSLKTRMLSLQEQAAQYERQGKKPDPKLLQGIDNTHNEIQDSYASILRREKDKELISEEYSANIARFRELKNLREESMQEARNATSSVSSGVDFNLVETAVICETETACEKYWITARNYGRKFATTGIQVDAPKIFLSKPAVANEDISVTVSRVRPKRDGNEVIFLDITCKPTVSGLKTCQSDKVKSIRSGFKAAVLGNR